MTDTHECLHCKKTTSRKNNFCCGVCRKQYNKLHKTNIGVNDWDYIDAKIPGFTFVVKIGPMLLFFPLNILLEYKLIPPWVAIIICCICLAYLITFMIRFSRL